MKLNPVYSKRNIDNEAVLLNTQTGNVVTLNETASVILESIQNNMDVTQIKQTIENQFDCQNVDLDTEIQNTIESLKQKNLIL